MKPEDQVLAGMQNVTQAMKVEFDGALDDVKWDAEAATPTPSDSWHTLTFKAWGKKIRLPISRERLEDSASTLRPDMAVVIKELARGFAPAMHVLP